VEEEGWGGVLVRACCGRENGVKDLHNKPQNPTAKPPTVAKINLVREVVLVFAV
jgi:hypothetical protein